MRTITQATVLTADSLAAVVSAARPPCLSLYQATHRQHPTNRQDPIRYRNHVKTLAELLEKQYPGVDRGALLKPFELLAHDDEFWNHTLDGLAVLVGTGIVWIFILPRPVDDLVVVGETFHTEPLQQFLRSADRYQVLALTRQDVRLFEGNRDGLEEVALNPGVPSTIAKALGDDLTEPHQTVASYGGVGGASVPMHHGQGAKADEVDTDTERYFRAVDRAVLTHHSRPSGLPLILAALPEYHRLFHTVSENPHLVAEGIRLDPGSLSLESCRDLAWQVMEPRLRTRDPILGDPPGDRIGSAS